MDEQVITHSAVREEFKTLTYAPLPYDSHPIDVANGPQGWGPFPGAYTPCDFEAAKDAMAPGGIDIWWTQGDNASAVNQPPLAAIVSLMEDKSLDYVNNPGFAQLVMENSGHPVLHSTIAQASNVQATGVAPTPKGSHGFWQSLKDLIAGM